MDFVQDDIGKEIGKCLDTSAGLNHAYLADWQKEIFDKYFNLLCVDTPPSYLLGALNVKASQALCNNRVSVRIPASTQNTPINMYFIAIMKSGSGKDRTLSKLDNDIFNLINDDFEGYCNREWVRAKKKISDLAEQKFHTRGEKDRYKKTKEPRRIVDKLGNATIEGLMDMRLVMEEASFGSTCLIIPELGHYIMNKSNMEGGILGFYTEIFDMGSNDGKVIKSEKNCRSVRGVPATLIAYGSPTGLTNEAGGSDKLKEFLNIGLARRFFICIPDQDEFVSFERQIKGCKDMDEYWNLKELQNAKKEQAHENAKTLSKKMFFSYDKLRVKITETTGYDDTGMITLKRKGVGKVFKLEHQAQKLFHAYDDYCKYSEKYKKVEYDNEGMAGEGKNRSWKALKLAGVIAAFRNPANLMVTKDDMECAIHQAEYFGSHLTRFYFSREDGGVERLYRYFIQNKGKDLTKSDIRNQKFVSTNKFDRWFPQALESILELCELNGLHLVLPTEMKRRNPNLKNVKLYKLENMKTGRSMT